MPPRGKAKARAKARAKSKAQAKAKAKSRQQVRALKGLRPQLRRPAAAPKDSGQQSKAQAKAKAKSRPKARALKGLLRRAAAAPKDSAQQAQQGEQLLPLSELKENFWAPGTRLVAEGSYWGSVARVAGTVRAVRWESGGKSAEVEVSGCTTEELLKWGGLKLENREPLMMNFHLCGGACESLTFADDLLHVERATQVKEFTDWQVNLLPAVPTAVDELAQLRQALPLPPLPEEPPRVAGKAAPDQQEKHRPGEERTAEKKRSKRKSRPAEEEVKNVELLFSGSGLDPKVHLSRYCQPRSSKKRRRTPSSGSSSTDSSVVDVHGFGEEQKIRKLHQRCPGALSRLALNEVRGQLAAATAENETKQDYAPMFIRYYRQTLRAKLATAASREFLTLSHAADLLLSGRAASALDTLVQRMKAIEHVSQGGSWGTSQYLEVIPPERGGITSREEVLIAQKEQKEELKVRRPLWDPRRSVEDSNRESTWKGTGKGKPWARTNQGDTPDKGGAKGEHAVSKAGLLRLSR